MWVFVSPLFSIHFLIFNPRFFLLNLLSSCSTFFKPLLSVSPKISSKFFSLSSYVLPGVFFSENLECKIFILLFFFSPPSSPSSVTVWGSPGPRQPSRASLLATISGCCSSLQVCPSESSVRSPRCVLGSGWGSAGNTLLCDQLSALSCLFSVSSSYQVLHPVGELRQQDGVFIRRHHQRRHQNLKASQPQQHKHV